MKKVYLVIALFCLYASSNAQKVYFRQTFDKPTFDGKVNFISSGDLFGPDSFAVALSSNYSNPKPDSNQFTYIGTSSAYIGTDSLVSDGNGGYAIDLIKQTGSGNAASLARSVPLAELTPSFLKMNFDITPSEFSAAKAANSFYVTLGQILDTIRSESAKTNMTFRMAISPNGGATNIFRLRDPATPATMGVDSFKTGSKYNITLVANNGTDTAAYHIYSSPDGKTDSVLGGRWDAWITTSAGISTKELVGRKIVNPSIAMTGFRFLVTNAPQVSYILDNILITDGSNATLPINISKFDATKLNSNASSISWSVANATSVKQFIIAKSSDGENFKNVGTVSYAGTKNYSFTDNSLSSGINYFRLTTVELNGFQSYSKVVAIVNKPSGAAVISLAPSLVRSTTTLSVSAATTDKVTARVVDAFGRTVIVKSTYIPAGNTQLAMDFSTLKAGSYYLQTIFSDGSGKTILFEKQ